MRSVIAQVPGTSDVTITRDMTTVLKLDAQNTPLQAIERAAKSYAKAFDVRLLLEVESTDVSLAAFAKARQAIARVPGVIEVSPADDDGVFSVAFDPNERTSLSPIIEAARQAGLTVHTPRTRPLK